MSQTQQLLGTLPKRLDLFTNPAASPEGGGPEKYYNILVMGTPGIGKTTFACQGPAPVVLIDVEKGGEGIVPSARFFPQLREVDVRRPESISQIDKIFWEIRGGKIPCKTLVLDTLTEMQGMHLDEIRSAKNEDTNTQPDYNKNLNVMRKHLIGFRDLPVNLVIITHVSEETDDVTGAKVIRPDLTPKLSGLVRSMTDMIAWMQIDSKLKVGGAKGETVDTRTLTCTPSRRVWTKNRLGITERIENPTWNSVIVNYTNNPARKPEQTETKVSY